MDAATAQKARLERIAEGREAEIFAWGEGNVLRLLRQGWGDAAKLEREAAAMRAAAGVGAAVPEPREIVEVDGRAGLVMSRIDGIDLLAVVGKRPWTVWRAGTITGDVHATLNAAAAPAGLPDLKESIRTRIEAVRGSPEAPPHLVDFILGRLDGLPAGDRLCHGDFHPGNIIMAGGAPVVIDWPNARSGDPHADFARTLLMLRVGELPPGAPALIRLLERFGRRLLLTAYRRAYRRSRDTDMALVERWMPVRAADRLLEGIDPERPALMRIIERAEEASRARA